MKIYCQRAFSIYSILSVVRPAMKALISKAILGHSDIDVKVSITSCLSEIIRITSLDAPYDDDIMKETFGLIIGAFKNWMRCHVVHFRREFQYLKLLQRFDYVF
ncbi:hypothetical protein KFK09_003751 [Dendrobium nobile]|uniref:Uncharacterized protein n=1 Tax=Dendrobium nobile TaxID=94219 RepID=A0A8T3C132_DENNO|nr:hypothetical protein KFK09_003751 [Dendrobium nobile]